MQLQKNNSIMGWCHAGKVHGEHPCIGQHDKGYIVCATVTNALCVMEFKRIGDTALMQGNPSFPGPGAAMCMAVSCVIRFL